MADYKKGDTASWDTEQVRRGQSEHRKSRPRKRRKNPVLRFFAYILFVLIVSAILAGVGWLLMNDL